MAEREAWLNWRNGIRSYWVCDCQENFYKFLRERIALDADDYDARIAGIIQIWKCSTVSE